VSHNSTRTAPFAQLFKSNYIKAKAGPGGSVQRDCIRTADTASMEAIARAGRAPFALSQSLWDVEDARLLEVMEKHRVDLLQRQPTDA
jgi:hypothetical protein